MLIRRLCLPWILQVRAVLAVILLQAPQDWAGGYGRDPEAEWIYKCTQCGYEKPLPEQLPEGERLFCGKNP